MLEHEAAVELLVALLREMLGVDTLELARELPAEEDWLAPSVLLIGLLDLFLVCLRTSLEAGRFSMPAS